MLKLVKTDSKNLDFQNLVRALDADLQIRDGKDSDFYAQFNKITMIKHAIVAYDAAGNAVGCGAIKAFSEEAMEVKRMYVLPEKRGHNIASTILKSLESWAKELNYAKTVLETGQKQPEAIEMYKKMVIRLYPIMDNMWALTTAFVLRKNYKKIGSIGV